MEKNILIKLLREKKYGSSDTFTIIFFRKMYKKKIMWQNIFYILDINYAHWKYSKYLGTRNRL